MPPSLSGSDESAVFAAQVAERVAAAVEKRLNHEERLDAYERRLVAIAGEQGDNGKVGAIKHDVAATKGDITALRSSLSRAIYFFLGMFLLTGLGGLYNLGAFERGMNLRVEQLERTQEAQAKLLETVRSARCPASP